jgi:flagellar basal body-associated protein FliL
VKKGIIVGIIAIVIIVGVVSILSMNTISLTDGSKSTSKDAGNGEQESKPVGRNLSIELEEKMGFTAP